MSIRYKNLFLTSGSDFDQIFSIPTGMYNDAIFSAKASVSSDSFEILEFDVINNDNDTISLIIPAETTFSSQKYKYVIFANTDTITEILFSGLLFIDWIPGHQRMLF